MDMVVLSGAGVMAGAGVAASDVRSDVEPANDAHSDRASLSDLQQRNGYRHVRHRDVPLSKHAFGADEGQNRTLHVVKARHQVLLVLALHGMDESHGMGWACHAMVCDVDAPGRPGSRAR